MILVHYWEISNKVLPKSIEFADNNGFIDWIISNWSSIEIAEIYRR